MDSWAPKKPSGLLPRENALCSSPTIRSPVAYLTPAQKLCRYSAASRLPAAVGIEWDLTKSIHGVVIFPSLSPDAVHSALASDAAGGVTCPHRWGCDGPGKGLIFVLDNDSRVGSEEAQVP